MMVSFFIKQCNHKKVLVNEVCHLRKLPQKQRSSLKIQNFTTISSMDMTLYAPQTREVIIGF
jgi:hypothetical protein